MISALSGLFSANTTKFIVPAASQTPLGISGEESRKARQSAKIRLNERAKQMVKLVFSGSGVMCLCCKNKTELKCY